AAVARASASVEDSAVTARAAKEKVRSKVARSGKEEIIGLVASELSACAGTDVGARVAQIEGRARHSVRAAMSVDHWNSGPFFDLGGAHGVTRPTFGRPART